MTREVVGAWPPETTGEPLVIVFDLGELAHDAPGVRADPPAPMADRMRRLHRPPVKAAIAIMVALTLATAAGWHVGTGRAESRQAALIQAHPPALAWLTFMGSSNDVASGLPHIVLDLNVMNLGPTELRVTSVLSTTVKGTATADLRPNSTVVAAPGETAHRIVDVGGQCGTAYSGARLRVDLQLGRSPYDRTTAQVNTVDDGSVGVPYGDVLQALCAPSSPVVTAGGLDGVYVQQTSHAEGAVLVVTNHATAPREVGFAIAERDGFALRTSPRRLPVLGSGRSYSILVTFTVTDCRDVGRLTNYADGVTLQVRPTDLSARARAANDPAELSLRDVVLAPLGAAVQKACH